MRVFETGHQGEWTKGSELPFDGRIIEIEGEFGNVYRAFYNHITNKWRSYPDGYLISDGDSVVPISQWRETGLSVLIPFGCGFSIQD